jgi:radical SAM enzyme (TIGR01210 family)
LSARFEPPYPDALAGRDRWILERRGPRRLVDPRRPVGAFCEMEAAENGRPEPVATIFLANRECPWKCLMCDLWKDTLADSVPAGAIAGQIAAALGGLPPARRVKLYNAGSFFDPKAIAPSEHPAIASLLGGFERVIVEAHPALVGEACAKFRDRLSGRLEVAMGLETAHPEVLARLNKRMDLALFERAACFLRTEGIALRVFVLVGLPFLSEAEGLLWTARSAALAFECGAGAVSLIPTRAGNGALEALERRGEFVRPRLAALEAAVEEALALRRGRVFADTWNLDEFSRCASCFASRRDRLAAVNLHQTLAAAVECPACGGAS